MPFAKVIWNVTGNYFWSQKFVDSVTCSKISCSWSCVCEVRSCRLLCSCCCCACYYCHMFHMIFVVNLICLFDILVSFIVICHFFFAINDTWTNYFFGNTRLAEWSVCFSQHMCICLYRRLCCISSCRAEILTQSSVFNIRCIITQKSTYLKFFFNNVTWWVVSTILSCLILYPVGAKTLQPDVCCLCGLYNLFPAI